MDYEKKYKNALEWARQVMNGETGFIRKEVEEIFPELAESDDERIRRELIEHVIWSEDNQDISTDEMERWLAWLEKQGEKTSDPRYSILAKLIEADDIYQMSVNDAMVEEAKNKAIKALSKLEISKLFGLKKQGEQKPFNYEHANIQQKDFAPKVEPKFKKE